MNLFQKYGIKEVADVVFYSITTIGDEEFYTPVLFLDTLKVSTLEKAAEKVEAKGGKGNKKLITWNFGKEITLNLEDALFSPASMSMIWGGKLNSKLSDYTSAIVKSNLANKYYDLKYSIKAYPSPALTDNEWEVIFKVAHELGYDSGSGNINPYIYVDNTNEGDYHKFVEENRISFIKQYFNRDRKSKQLTVPLSIFNLPEIEPKLYNALSFGTRPTRKIAYFTIPQDQATQILNTYHKLGTGESTIFTLVLGYGYYEAIYNNGEYVWSENVRGVGAALRLISIEKNESGAMILKATPLDKISQDEEPFLCLRNNLKETAGYWDDYFASETFSETNQYVQINLNEFATFLESDNADTIINNSSPMPQEIILNIISKLDSLDKIGNIETDFNDIEVIDRMEKCIVKNKKGLTINSQKQKDNLFKYYADDKNSSYTIYYDAKTMLPLFKINDMGEILNEDFTIKLGTVYYKWTRTVKYKESDDDAILGKTLVIDAETFPDAYKIVGETYIRNQKTGKDQRYQFIIHRANVSSDTSITLEAEGDPTTFSMQIDVLTPPNDIMMELKQYDVEDDPFEGGTRIVPQKSKYTYTPANVEYIEEVAEKNEEIY